MSAKKPKPAHGQRKRSASAILAYKPEHEPGSPISSASWVQQTKTSPRPSRLRRAPSTGGKQRTPSLSALKVGKGKPDDRVERSLYLRAVGYTYDAVKIAVFRGRSIVVPYREHVPPDTAADLLAEEPPRRRMARPWET